MGQGVTQDDIRYLLIALWVIYVLALTQASVVGYGLAKLVRLPLEIAGGTEEWRRPVTRTRKSLDVCGRGLLLAVLYFCIAGTGGWINMTYAKLHGVMYTTSTLWAGMAWGAIGCLLTVFAIWRGAVVGGQIAFSLGH